MSEIDIQAQVDDVLKSEIHIFAPEIDDRKSDLHILAPMNDIRTQNRTGFMPGYIKNALGIDIFAPNKYGFLPDKF
jgi:hypothetical protein